MKLSQRVLGINPSATLAVDAKAKALKAQGQDVISFGTGEPDFISPPAAFAYARDAMEKGKTHYTPTAGVPELRREISNYYQQRFGLSYSPSQIVVSSGAKLSIYEALEAIVDPGDEVILLAPTWVSYLEQIRLAGGKAVVVDTEESGFLPALDQVKAAVTPKTVAILLNSPTNPTGVMLEREFLAAVGDLVIERDLWLIWDEIYERLTYGQAQHYNPVQLVPELAARTVLINGVSKSYAMTGWRIGYLLAPQELAAKIIAFQSHLTSNPASISQWAALGAMEHGEDDVIRMREAFGRRRELICNLLAQMPLISFPEPRGAFYVFVNVKQYLGKTYQGRLIKNDLDFCSLLLDSELVAVVPGSAFQVPGYFRVSYAVAPEVIRRGMERLERFLAEIEKENQQPAIS